jgi:hypothetical protein
MYVRLRAPTHTLHSAQPPRIIAPAQPHDCDFGFTTVHGAQVCKSAQNARLPTLHNIL